MSGRSLQVDLFSSPPPDPFTFQNIFLSTCMCHTLNTLDTIGNCQRLIVKDNNERKTLVTRSCVLSDA